VGKRASAEGNVPAIDFFIINVPILLFLSGAVLALALLAGLRPAFPLMLAFIVPAWWCACGALMLGIDYSKRKRSMYMRLRTAGAPGPRSPLGRSLKQTICSAMLYAAVLRYAREIRT
jgi:hypothetical protein